MKKDKPIPDYIHLYQDDLPDNMDLGSTIAIDTETMGLNHYRDRLCLIQISKGDGKVYLVQFIPEHLGGKGFTACHNLKKILTDPSIVKLMHYARFDVGILQQSLNIQLNSIKCTKIAAKLVRTFTEKHSLAALCRELLNIEMNKHQQTSDWGATTLTTDQLIYAASDVLYLHRLWDVLEKLLIRENRLSLAQACFSFLPARAQLDQLGYLEPDIFDHKS